MNKARAFATLAALSLSAASAETTPQPAANPTDIIDTVEVTAQRETNRKAIHTYVANVTRFDGENIARWRAPKPR
jgi:outer membrane cobalamin receptor